MQEAVESNGKRIILLPYYLDDGIIYIIGKIS
jgi:hypothetical protein